MGFFENMFGNKGKWEDTLIKDVIEMLAISNNLGENEIKEIIKASIELNIDKDRVAYISNNLDKIKIVYPEKLEDKIKYLELFIKVIIVNGVVEEHEKRYLLNVTRKLNLDEEIFHEIIAQLLKQSENNNETGLTLKLLVNKQNNLVQGIFANINNDLNEYFTEDNDLNSNSDYEHKLLHMSYAYARRTAAAGLVLQGVFSINDFNHAQKVFKITQQLTIHTKEFQDEAYSNAIDYIMSYDDKLNIEILTEILSTLMKNTNIKTAKELGEYYTYEEILNRYITNNKANKSDLDFHKEKEALDETIIMLVNVINLEIETKDIALQFVLEELNDALYGDNSSIQFALTCGFSEIEIRRNRKNNFTREIEKIQEILLILHEIEDKEIMAKMRCTIINMIMKIWKLGKYDN